MRYAIKTLIPIMVTAVVILLTACNGEQSKTARPEIADPEAGKTLAQENCTGCHSMDGKGATGDIPNLAAQVESYLYASLKAYAAGKRRHAALRDMTLNMSDEDMRNVAAYFSGLSPVKSSAEQQLQDIQEKGKATSSACTLCHGNKGMSKISGVPSLAGQQPGYFISAVNDYKEGKRKMPSKEKEQAMVKAVDRVDIESMALYYASIKPARRDAPSFGNAQAGEPLTANCGGCHGAHGNSSDPAIPNLAGQEPTYLKNAIQAYRDNARQQQDMHNALSGVSDSDIENIAAYYATQIPRPAEEDTVSMKSLAEKCDRCHGPGMENPMMIIPKISGQNRDYLIKALHAYQDNKRGSSPMHKMSLPYSAAVIEGIAAWYANQPAR